MGGFGGGFLQGFTGAVQKKIDQKQAEDTKLKDEKRQMYWKIAYDTTGAYSDAQKQSAQQELNKLLSPDAKKANQKFGDIFGKLTKQGQQQQGAQPSPAAQASLAQPKTAAPGASTDDPGAPGAVLSQPQTPKPKSAQGPQPSPNSGINAQPKTPAPQPSSGLPPIQTDADINSREDAQAQAAAKRADIGPAVDRERRTKEAEGAGLTGRDKVEFVETGRLPATGSPGTRKAEQWELENGTKMDIDYDPKSGVRYDPQGNAWEVPEGAKRVATPKSVGQLRQLKYAVTLGDAKARSADGAKFKDVEGKDIDIDKLPVTNVLEAMETGDGRIVYTPVSPTENTFTVGNKVYARTPFNSALTGTNAPNAPVDLGPARTGSANTPTNVVRDAQGVPHVLGSTTQPNTPGATPRQSQAPSPAQGPPSPRAQASLPQPATPAPSTGGARSVAGVTPGMDKDYLQTARTIQQALTQVVGDENNPDLKTLVSTAPKVLEDPKAVKRVGTAIKMALGQGSGDLDGAHVSTGVGVGPVSVGLGGFGSYLNETLNIPKKTAEKINENLQNAMKDMSEDERQLVASTVSAFEESIAMRAINKSGVSNAQVSAIQNTLPLVGVNTFNKGDFATRTTNWIQQGLNGSWGVPPNYFRPDFLNRLKAIPGEMEQLKGKGKPSPKAQKSLAAPAPKTADQYLQSIGAP